MNRKKNKERTSFCLLTSCPDCTRIRTRSRSPFKEASWSGYSFIKQNKPTVELQSRKKQSPTAPLGKIFGQFGNNKNIQKLKMSDEYQEWLNSDRKNREFHFQIAMALAKIRAKFSYLRLEGIAELIRFLRSLKEEDYECFCLLQDVEENNIALHVMKAPSFINC